MQVSGHAWNLACSYALDKIGTHFGLSFLWQTFLWSKVWEVTMGLYTLCNGTKQGHLHTKHIVVKYHFFHSHVGSNLHIWKVNTTEQLADFLLKVLLQTNINLLLLTLWGTTVMLLTYMNPCLHLTMSLLCLRTFSQWFSACTMRGSEVVHPLSGMIPRPSCSILHEGQYS